MPIFIAEGTPGPEGECGLGKKLGVEFAAETGALFLEFNDTTLPAIRRTASTIKTVANIFLPLPIPSGAFTSCPCICTVVRSFMGVCAMIYTSSEKAIWQQRGSERTLAPPDFTIPSGQSLIMLR
jgi:hypothetical protein